MPPNFTGQRPAAVNTAKGNGASTTPQDPAPAGPKPAAESGQNSPDPESETGENSVSTVGMRPKIQKVTVTEAQIDHFDIQGACWNNLPQVVVLALMKLSKAVTEHRTEIMKLQSIGDARNERHLKSFNEVKQQIKDLKTDPVTPHSTPRAPGRSRTQPDHLEVDASMGTKSTTSGKAGNSHSLHPVGKRQAISPSKESDQKRERSQTEKRHVLAQSKKPEMKKSATTGAASGSFTVENSFNLESHSLPERSTSVTDPNITEAKVPATTSSLLSPGTSELNAPGAASTPVMPLEKKMTSISLNRRASASAAASGSPKERRRSSERGDSRPDSPQAEPSPKNLVGGSDHHHPVSQEPNSQDSAPRASIKNTNLQIAKVHDPKEPGDDDNASGQVSTAPQAEKHAPRKSLESNMEGSIESKPQGEQHAPRKSLESNLEGPIESKPQAEKHAPMEITLQLPGSSDSTAAVAVAPTELDADCDADVVSGPGDDQKRSSLANPKRLSTRSNTEGSLASEAESPGSPLANQKKLSARSISQGTLLEAESPDGSTYRYPDDDEEGQLFSAVGSRRSSVAGGEFYGNDLVSEVDGLSQRFATLESEIQAQMAEMSKQMEAVSSAATKTDIKQLQNDGDRLDSRLQAINKRVNQELNEDALAQFIWNRLLQALPQWLHWVKASDDNTGESAASFFKNLKTGMQGLLEVSASVDGRLNQLEKGLTSFREETQDHIAGFEEKLKNSKSGKSKLHSNRGSLDKNAATVSKVMSAGAVAKMMSSGKASDDSKEAATSKTSPGDGDSPGYHDGSPHDSNRTSKEASPEADSMKFVDQLEDLPDIVPQDAAAEDVGYVSVQEPDAEADVEKDLGVEAVDLRPAVHAGRNLLGRLPPGQAAGKSGQGTGEADPESPSESNVPVAIGEASVDDFARTSKMSSKDDILDEDSYAVVDELRTGLSLVGYQITEHKALLDSQAQRLDLTDELLDQVKTQSDQNAIDSAGISDALLELDLDVRARFYVVEHDVDILQRESAQAVDEAIQGFRSEYDELIGEIKHAYEMMGQRISVIFPKAAAEAKKAANFNVGEARYFAMEKRIAHLEESFSSGGQNSANPKSHLQVNHASSPGQGLRAIVEAQKRSLTADGHDNEIPDDVNTHRDRPGVRETGIIPQQRSSRWGAVPARASQFGDLPAEPGDRSSHVAMIRHQMSQHEGPASRTTRLMGESSMSRKSNMMMRITEALDSEEDSIAAQGSLFDDHDSPAKPLTPLQKMRMSNSLATMKQTKGSSNGHDFNATTLTSDIDGSRQAGDSNPMKSRQPESSSAILEEMQDYGADPFFNQETSSTAQPHPTDSRISHQLRSLVSAGQSKAVGSTVEEMQETKHSVLHDERGTSKNSKFEPPNGRGMTSSPEQGVKMSSGGAYPKDVSSADRQKPQEPRPKDPMQTSSPEDVVHVRSGSQRVSTPDPVTSSVTTFLNTGTLHSGRNSPELLEGPKSHWGSSSGPLRSGGASPISPQSMKQPSRRASNDLGDQLPDLATDEQMEDDQTKKVQQGPIEGGRSPSPMQPFSFDSLPPSNNAAGLPARPKSKPRARPPIQGQPIPQANSCATQRKGNLDMGRLNFEEVPLPSSQTVEV